MVTERLAMHQPDKIPQRAEIAAGRREFLHPFYVTGRTSVSRGKCRGGTGVRCYLEGDSPMLLCSRQIHTEFTMQDSVKAGHRASGKATSCILLTAFPGSISGVTAASKGLAGFNFYAPQTTYYQMS